MPARLKMFDRITPCNPYKEFWEFLEWLGKRRQYPVPLSVWNAVNNQPGKKPNTMKLPAANKEIYRFPGADDDTENVNTYRRK